MKSIVVSSLKENSRKSVVMEGKSSTNSVQSIRTRKTANPVSVQKQPKSTSKEALSIRRVRPGGASVRSEALSQRSRVNGDRSQRHSKERRGASKEKTTYQKSISKSVMERSGRGASKEKTDRSIRGGGLERKPSGDKSIFSLSVEKLTAKSKFSIEEIEGTTEEKSVNQQASKEFLWSLENKDPKAHETEEWFHGLLPREDINKLLRNNGDFLVRLSEPLPGKGMKFVLSARWKDKNWHFIIYEVKGKYAIEKHQNSTIYQLINMLGKDKKPVNETNGVILLQPVPKQDWELSHEQITLGKLLGEGAFGGVYAGELVQAGKTFKVAVKVNKGKETTKRVIKEICKEARIMRRYQHANVVKFYGVAVAKEPIMLVMEMVDGGSLDSLLKTKKTQTTTADRLRYATGAARGLEYLHSKGCIHRDVAARNYLYHEGEVKISDFGLSRELSDRAAKYKLKDLKQRLPIRWLAPEVLTTATYSFRSDVYSYGILLWEIWSDAATPYSGMTLAEVNAKVRTGYRLAAPDLMPNVVRDIMTIHCFPAKPEDRWSMTEIITTLESEKETASAPQ